MSVAIDYSASNGDISSPDSLHKVGEGVDGANPYEAAMYSVGKILETYAHGKLFMAYGFGGIPEFLNETKTSNCFPLNGKYDDAGIKGL